MLTVALICTLCFAAGRQSAAACRWMGRAASVIIILESSMIVPGTSEGDPAWHSESGTQGRDGSPGDTATATHIARRGPAPVARLAGPGPLARAMNVALRLAASQFPAPCREVNGDSHRMFCSLHLSVYIYGSNHGQR